MTAVELRQRVPVNICNEQTASPAPLIGSRVTLGNRQLAIERVEKGSVLVNEGWGVNILEENQKPAER